MLVAAGDLNQSGPSVQGLRTDDHQLAQTRNLASNDGATHSNGGACYGTPPGAQHTASTPRPTPAVHRAAGLDHAEEMRRAERRGATLAEAWCEAYAAGASVRPIDVAIDTAVRDYRRAEKKVRRDAKRAEASA